MSVQSRLAQLEKQHEGEHSPDLTDRRERWQAAYAEIALTMDAHEFAGVHAEIKRFFERVSSGEINYWSGHSVLSFVAARVLSLAGRAGNNVRAINGIPLGFFMTPALSQAWRDHDERLATADPDERHKGSFETQTCADCGAEHPWLGRYEHDFSRGRMVIANPDELIKTCLVCGGVVGRLYGGGHTSATELAEFLG